jgi:hypothetical protein
MKDLHIVIMKYCAFICATLLLCAAPAAAAPLTVGTFEVSNDFFGSAFSVTNDSAFTFGDLHLLFDLTDASNLDFVLTDVLLPVSSIDSNGLVDGFGQSALPDLGTVQDAYLALTILDPLTNAVVPGMFSLVPTDPSLCVGCTDKMSDFADQSTLAIQFDAASPTPVPEPPTLMLFATALMMVAAMGTANKRRRRSQ